MDLSKYRAVFIEEATEHLAEISQSLLALEKEPDRTEAIDLIFRMAHSVKGMAASLDYDAITQVAHALEDRMQAIRASGRVAPGTELADLFADLEALEAMVACVRETGEPPTSPPGTKGKKPRTSRPCPGRLVSTRALSAASRSKRLPRPLRYA